MLANSDGELTFPTVLGDRIEAAFPELGLSFESRRGTRLQRQSQGAANCDRRRAFRFGAEFAW